MTVRPAGVQVPFSLQSITGPAATGQRSSVEEPFAIARNKSGDWLAGCGRLVRSIYDRDYGHVTNLYDGEQTAARDGDSEALPSSFIEQSGEAGARQIRPSDATAEVDAS